MNEGKIETFSGIKGLSEFTVYRYSLGRMLQEMLQQEEEGTWEREMG